MDVSLVSRARGVALVLVVTLGLVSCAPQGVTPAQTGQVEREARGPKRVMAAIRGNPDNLSLAISSSSAGGVAGVREIERLLHAGLAIEDHQGTLRPQLAETVPTVENGRWKVSPDGRMETTWTLRPDARWHDGTPVTADDLVFAATVFQDDRVGIAREPALGAVERIEATDPRTITVFWKQPFLNADALFTGARRVSVLPLPKHLLERAYLDDKASFTQQPYWTADFVGAGPFRLREWARDSHLIMTASEDYALGRPRIDEIQIRFITDPSAMAANILAGAVELMLGGGRGLSLEWGLQVRDQWRDGKLEVTLADSWLSVYPQMLNPQPPILGDVRIRRALLHAVDRQEMVDSIQGGMAPIAHSIISPNQPEYQGVQDSILRYDYDVRRAAQIIEGLGYSKGADGVFRDAAGERLTIEIRTTRGDDLQEKSMFSVADYWQRLGVNVEQVTISSQLQRDREYRASRPAFEVVRNPNGMDAIPRYHGSQTPLPENNFVGVNRIRYRNAELDGLIDRALTTILFRERVPIVAQIVRHMTDQVLVLGMFYDPDIMPVGNRLRNVIPSELLWNAHEWDVA